MFSPRRDQSPAARRRRHRESFVHIRKRKIRGDGTLHRDSDARERHRGGRSRRLRVRKAMPSAQSASSRIPRTPRIGVGSIGLAKSVVIEADVAAGDGNVEGAAGFSDAIDGFAELPHHFGLFGIAEIEAIGGGQRDARRCSDIARSFGDGMHRANARIESWHQRPLPSVESARARLVPLRRTTAASPAPGPTRVLVRTM